MTEEPKKNHWYKMYELECLKTKELEKENAELKKKNLDTQDAVTMQMYTNKANKEIADRQLTKAKELLRFWVNDFFDSFNNSNRYEERHQALEQSEQFLKENE